MAEFNGQSLRKVVFNTGFTAMYNSNVLPVDIHTLYQMYAVDVCIYTSIF